MPEPIAIEPATPERWRDLEDLFGPRGAYGGCWCMWWRQTSAQFDRGHGEPNRRALLDLVECGEVPGLLAYLGGQAVGWCSLGPREAFGRLQRSPVLKPVDDQPAWAIVCFYIARAARGRGVASALLQAATEYAAARGARIVEGYASDPVGGDAALYTGTVSMFEQAGFVEAAHRRPSARRIMRWYASGGP